MINKALNPRVFQNVSAKLTHFPLIFEVYMTTWLHEMRTYFL